METVSCATMLLRQYLVTLYALSNCCELHAGPQNLSSSSCKQETGRLSNLVFR